MGTETHLSHRTQLHRDIHPAAHHERRQNAQRAHAGGHGTGTWGVRGAKHDIHGVPGAEGGDVRSPAGGKGLCGQRRHALPHPFHSDAPHIRPPPEATDHQHVSISLRVLSTPKEESLPALYMQYGLDYDERVLPSIGNEALKGVVAQFDAAQLITMREVVSQKVREQLTQRATDFGIVLKDVAITHLAFGEEFTKAIESKQVMYQEAERSKYVVQKSDQLRKAAVIKAEGDAEYAQLMQEATRNSPGFLELRKIEASKEIVNKLSNNPNISYLPKDGNFILGLGGNGRI